MSNLFQSTSSGAALLKNVYKGPVIDQLSEDIPEYRAAEKVTDKWSGLQVIRPWRVRRNQGIGATTDGGTLPAIGRQTTVQATITAKFNYLRLGITGPMLKSSASDQGSFVRDFAYELEMGYKDLADDLDRQFGWDGDGDLATVNTTAVASLTLVVAGRTSTEPAIKFLDVGMAFDIYSSAGALVQSSVTITAISGGPEDATATLTCDQAVSATATDILVRAGSYGNEIQGILYSLDGGTGAIYGVNRATYPSTQGNVTNANSGQLTLDLLQTPFNNALRRGGRKFSAVRCDFDSLRFYQKLLAADKRYSNTLEGDGTFGKKGEFYMNHNGIPVVPSKNLPRTFLFLDASYFKNYVLCEMEPADESGSEMIPQTSADALETRLRFFSNFFNEQPSAAGRLHGYVSP